MRRCQKRFNVRGVIVVPPIYMRSSTCGYYAKKSANQQAIGGMLLVVVDLAAGDAVIAYLLQCSNSDSHR